MTPIDTHTHTSVVGALRFISFVPHSFLLINLLRPALWTPLPPGLTVSHWLAFGIVKCCQAHAEFFAAIQLKAFQRQLLSLYLSLSRLTQTAKTVAFVATPPVRPTPRWHLTSVSTWAVAVVPFFVPVYGNAAYVQCLASVLPVAAVCFLSWQTKRKSFRHTQQ